MQCSILIDWFLLMKWEFFSFLKEACRNSQHTVKIGSIWSPNTELYWTSKVPYWWNVTNNDSICPLKELVDISLKHPNLFSAIDTCTGMLKIVSQISLRYMTEILPLTNWKQEAVRPGLNLILRRLDRLFNKISKKSSLRVQLSYTEFWKV